MDEKLAKDRTYGIGEVEPPREIDVDIGNGIKGTLTIPHSVDLDDFLQLGYAPPTKKVALILHGQGGHRDYCYQKLVAHRLAADLGHYSLRIDFRGCGYLDDHPDTKEGRTLTRDIEDIQTCVEYLLDSSRNAVNINFLLLSIIAHSRGSAAMFLWAVQQEELVRSGKGAKAVIVPNLINCSARYRLETIYERYTFLDQDFEFIEQTAMRFGKYQPTKVTKAELLSLSSPDLSVVRKLSTAWSVLSVYGLEDHIIPREDCAYYANALSRGPYTHQLELIEGADHNFYGRKAVTDDLQEDLNPNGYPLNKKKRINYNYLVSAIITKYLRYDQELLRFATQTKYIGGIPRSKTVDGIANFRDVGGWKINAPTFHTATQPGTCYYMRPGYLFRCANTIDISETGAEALKNLGIRSVYDLRSIQECEKDGVSPLFETVDVERFHAPVFRNEDYSPQLIAVRLSHLITSWHTYVNIYEHMLDSGTSLFRTMFEHIRDHPDRPLVFHCTAGKDRTGVFAMLALRLAGLDRHTIAGEYELTTYGLLPDHAKIKQKYVTQMQKLRSKEGAAALEELISRGRKNWSIEDDGFANLISSRHEAMLDTIDLLDTKYGGIVEYMKNVLDFSEHDIKKIFNNLVFTDSCKNEPFLTSGEVSKF
ncbi:CIC11C00000005204 [Sungouiella intermedia]|uniref:CIC11C00000005204 n=1 Tax=Sungouiella intermedia TaxID=45354 RepID=A0A1L0C0W5_9ASCO|nr:CIC11C00000005204 [[Candida] intermedia]